MNTESGLLEHIEKMESANDLVGLEQLRLGVEAAIARLQEKAKQEKSISPILEKQVKENGGTIEEANDRAKVVDGAIDATVSEASESIKMIQEMQSLLSKVSMDSASPHEKARLYDALGQKTEADKIRATLAEGYEAQKADPFLAPFTMKMAADNYDALGDKEKAKAWYELYVARLEGGIESSKDAPADYMALAETYAKMGNIEKSQEAYKSLLRASESGGTVTENNYRLAAIANDKLGHKLRAEELWKKIAAKAGNKPALFIEANQRLGKVKEVTTMSKDVIGMEDGLRRKNDPKFNPELLAKAYVGANEKTKGIGMLKARLEELVSKNAPAKDVLRVFEILKNEL